MPALSPLFPELTATTLNELIDNLIYQNSYIETPLLRYFRASGALDPFGGGAAMQVPQLYQGAPGGSLFPGEDVTITNQQVVTAGTFIPKFYDKYYLINEFTIEVQNTGPEAKVSLLEAYLNQMMEGIDFQIEGNLFRHGQTSGSGVNDDRASAINGFSEAINDGVTPSWDGNVFQTYGGETRNGAIGPSLNSIPIWLGDQAGNPAPPNYQTLLKVYLTSIGRTSLMVTSYIGYSAIAAVFQRQQRYTINNDQNINWSGIKFEDATIFEDDIVPSSNPKPTIANLFYSPNGIAPAPGTIQTGQYTLTAAMLANQQYSGLPNLGFTSRATPVLSGGLNTIVVGEPIFFLDVTSFKYRPAKSEKFNYHLMDPLYWPNNPVNFVQHLRHSLNVYTGVPRRHLQGYGIKG